MVSVRAVMSAFQMVLPGFFFGHKLFRGYTVDGCDVPLRLCGEEIIVQSLVLHQLAVVADFNDRTVFEHNNLNMVIDMKLSLKKYIKRFCISHMARTLHGTQAELEARMAPYGVEVAYDGYETEI